jgi:16S rRNA (guanine527-N7)-methyltransferase
LQEGAIELGVDLSDSQLDQFVRCAGLLEVWNGRMNLTRVASEDFVTLHFLDSLAVLAVCDIPLGARCIDVGTGAGFPGIPLKIARPDLSMVLLDSTRKKLGFLQAVITELGLTDVSTVHARAEDAGKIPEHRQRYDFAFARAVAPLERLAGWLLPFVKAGGSAVALKGPGVEAEMETAEPIIRRLGATTNVMTLSIPSTELMRSIVVLRNRK